MVIRKKIKKILKQTFFPQKRLYKRMLKLKTSEERFSKIYQENLWSSNESKSGTGSTIAYTDNIRRELSNLIKIHQIETILDAPCGDFNWMSHVLKEHPAISYIGGDIVGQLILNNNENYGSQKVTFKKLDITKDILPPADIMIVRDCLIHLSFEDIYLFLENFCKSDINLLLVGSHSSEAHLVNKVISTGEHRYVDIFASPINLSEQTLYRFEDYLAPQPFQEQCLFERDTIQRSLENFHR